jgi:hypothetical protein
MISLLSLLRAEIALLQRNQKKESVPPPSLPKPTARIAPLRKHSEI